MSATEQFGTRLLLGSEVASLVLLPPLPFPSQVLSGVLAGVAALSVPQQVLAAGDSPIDIKDFRDQRNKGFDIIYEARDLDLDQDTRDGLTQARKDLNFTKNRVKESEKIIDETLEPLIKKNYW